MQAHASPVRFQASSGHPSHQPPCWGHLTTALWALSTGENPAAHPTRPRQGLPGSAGHLPPPTVVCREAPPAAPLRTRNPEDQGREGPRRGHGREPSSLHAVHVCRALGLQEAGHLRLQSTWRPRVSPAFSTCSECSPVAAAAVTTGRQGSRSPSEGRVSCRVTTQGLRPPRAHHGNSVLTACIYLR
uniref:Uncharacterized protein n=1 Tax=Rousettus aegyptiacus TaxID=9407 RepID=A0A7J8ILU0_ROUAE|nr:hypothetical protein HJG63_010539 [Rousettus aegyptiacus]